MKKSIYLAITLALSVCATAIVTEPSYAQIKSSTRPNESILQKLGSEIKNVLNTIKNFRDPKVACRKGEFKLLGPSVYSLRSFNGALCGSIPEVALYSYMLCTEEALGPDLYKEFISSQCYAKGYQYLKGKSANEAGDLLKEALMGRADPLKQMICANLDKAPAFLRSKIGGVCGSAG